MPAVPPVRRRRTDQHMLVLVQYRQEIAQITARLHALDAMPRTPAQDALRRSLWKQRDLRWFVVHGVLDPTELYGVADMQPDALPRIPIVRMFVGCDLLDACMTWDDWTVHIVQVRMVLMTICCALDPLHPQMHLLTPAQWHMVPDFLLRAAQQGLVRLALCDDDLHTSTTAIR